MHVRRRKFGNYYEGVIERAKKSIYKWALVCDGVTIYFNSFSDYHMKDSELIIKLN